MPLRRSKRQEEDVHGRKGRIGVARPQVESANFEPHRHVRRDHIKAVLLRRHALLNGSDSHGGLPLQDVRQVAFPLRRQV